MVYTGGSGGEREFHRNNKFRWCRLYLRVCLPAWQLFRPTQKSSLPTQAFFLSLRLRYSLAVRITGGHFFGAGRQVAA